MFLLLDVADYLIKREAGVPIVSDLPYIGFMGPQLIGATVGVFTTSLWLHRLFAL